MSVHFVAFFTSEENKRREKIRLEIWFLIRHKPSVTFQRNLDCRDG